MSFRNKKIEGLIKKEVSLEILKKGLFANDLLVTVASTLLYDKGYTADVYINVIPDQKANECLAILKKNVYDIQQDINKKLKIKPVPKLVFKIDTRTKEAIHIEEIFQKIHDDLSK